MYKMPKCCGTEMSGAMETSKFMEAHCGVCGDVIYVKKDSSQKPQMLDD